MQTNFIDIIRTRDSSSSSAAGGGARTRPGAAARTGSFSCGQRTASRAAPPEELLLGALTLR